MVSQVEEFNDKKTEGGDPSGDVFLFHMGTPEFERLKSYTELQRAVPTYSLPAADPLLEDGIWRTSVFGGLPSPLWGTEF